MLDTIIDTTNKLFVCIETTYDSGSNNLVCHGCGKVIASFDGPLDLARGAVSLGWGIKGVVGLSKNGYYPYCDKCLKNKE